jgi:AcrR family transcriptional regulator
MTENEKLTEEKIFEAATEVFIEKGLDGARMQDIAGRAGINKALLHYYYRTKDHLFNTVFERTVNKLFSRFSPVFDETMSFEEKIRFFYREHIAFLQDNPKLPAFLINEVNRRPERIRKLLSHVDFEKFWSILEIQHKDELEKYNINKKSIPQIMTTLASISVFPFAARGIIENLLEFQGVDFDQFLEERKEFAADFAIRALKKTEYKGGK